MKSFIASSTVFLALLAVQVAAAASAFDKPKDYDSRTPDKKPDYPDYPGPDSDGRHDRPDEYRDTQVLWGQCGGYYYYGTKKCPKGSYCHYFSDWYSQCNPSDK